MEPKGRTKPRENEENDCTVTPDYEDWGKLRESRSAWERIFQQLERLDADRLIPVSALITVGFCVLKGGPWYAYATVFTVATTAMLIDVVRKAVQRG